MIRVSAAILVGLLTVPAQAASCATVTDPLGDVTLAPGGVSVPDTHVDLRSVTLKPTSASLVVTVEDTALAPGRRGLWRVVFTSRHTRLFVMAGLGAWANFGDVVALDGFRAGLVGRTNRDVTGTFDYATSTITVTAPYRVFATALPTGSARLTDIVVEAQEVFVNDIPGGTQDVTLTDTAHASAVTIARC